MKAINLHFSLYILIITLSSCSNAKFQKENTYDVATYNITSFNESDLNKLSPIRTYVYEQTNGQRFRDSINVNYVNGTWIPEKNLSLNANPFYVYAISPPRSIAKNNYMIINYKEDVDYYYSDGETRKTITREDPFVEVNMIPIFSKIGFQVYTSDSSRDYIISRIEIDGQFTSFSTNIRIHYLIKGKTEYRDFSKTLDFECNYKIPISLSNDFPTFNILPKDKVIHQLKIIFTINNVEYTSFFTMNENWMPGIRYIYKFSFDPSYSRGQTEGSNELHFIDFSKELY